ncbi:hypothetical protein ERX46_00640 [Brumimicrobium glaciale]|uniref:Uncharacterized protein n=1 Tax=Brumimicrobium glaciale TaxID=200475 RepID=A0A4Q4KPR7_9FLAO|nr:hypothetical protein [Brumimicrobium glaciale]RYM35528.1 hypothetical protein ERX46_00640 [Brumimicrobium glaciale]
MGKHYVFRFNEKFLTAILFHCFLFFPSRHINCQVRLSAAISSGINLNIKEKPIESENKFYVSAIIGIELGLLLRSRIGFSLGYFHSQYNHRFNLPNIENDIKLLYSVRNFPMALELVVWKYSKNKYNLVRVVPDKYLSLKIGSMNILKQVAFGKDDLLPNKKDIDEYINLFNHQNFNKLNIEKNDSEKKIEFFKSPFVGIKLKLKDRNLFSISFEALYSFDLVPYDDVTIRSISDNTTLPTKFSSHILQIKANIALIYDN